MFAASHPDAIAVLPAIFTDEGFSFLKPSRARVYCQDPPAQPKAAQKKAAAVTGSRTAKRGNQQRGSGGGGGLGSLLGKVAGLALVTGGVTLGVQASNDAGPLAPLKPTARKLVDGECSWISSTLRPCCTMKSIVIAAVWNCILCILLLVRPIQRPPLARSCLISPRL